VHLAAIGHPILGDPLYGPSPEAPRPEGQNPAPRLRLHATELAFPDPRSGEPLQFRSPCPF
jgi:tRNA pseudouridine32 synthase/23S rRNA pseudouridine746 synthase